MHSQRLILLVLFFFEKTKPRFFEYGNRNNISAMLTAMEKWLNNFQDLKLKDLLIDYFCLCMNHVFSAKLVIK